MGWDAPFGKGRPGWHIECSAMAKAVLTEGTNSDTIDIHCGGVDLKFPHHENEIAQSNCSHDAPLANYWVHNEFLNMGKNKMSKSLGNVKLIHDLRKDWDGEVIRLALLKAQFDNELLWTDNLLTMCKNQLDGWYRKIASFPKLEKNPKCKYDNIFLESFLNNMDTVSAIFSIDTITNSIVDGVWQHSRIPLYFDNNRELSLEIKSEASSYLWLLANLLGLLQKDPEEWFKGGASANEEAEFDAIALRRQEARAAKDWAAADAARDEATAKGIVLEDGPDGTTWRKA